jgi:hypothetical protein
MKDRWGAYIKSPALELQCNIREVLPRCTYSTYRANAEQRAVAEQLACRIIHGLRVLVLTWRVSSMLRRY